MSIYEDSLDKMHFPCEYSVCVILCIEKINAKGAKVFDAEDAKKSFPDISSAFFAFTLAPFAFIL